MVLTGIASELAAALLLQQPVDLLEQQVEMERLGLVVVGTELETDEPVGLRIACGNEDHDRRFGNTRVLELHHHVTAVHAGQGGAVHSGGRGRVGHRHRPLQYEDGREHG